MTAPDRPSPALDPATPEQVLSSIFQSSQDAVLIASLDGTITDCNYAARRLYERSREETIGLGLGELFAAEVGEELKDRLSQATSEAAKVRWTTRGRARGGRHFAASVTLSPVCDQAGTVVAATIFVRDISGRVALEAELRRSKRELDRFAYIASHDLQEPLRMVSSFTELLAERYQGSLDERADKYISFALDGARRMQGMLSDLLVLSRITSQGKPAVPTEVGAVLAAVQDSLKAVIAETGATIEASEDLPAVLVDGDQLRQLLQNLVSNAIKFRGDRAPHIVVGARADGERWVVSVADNGIGVDPKHSQRIFELFQRLHVRGEFEGRGTGLAIAKRIVERHDGQIWVESTVGEGSTFFFSLARVEPSSA